MKTLYYKNFQNIIIQTINITILLYLFRTIIPVLKYPFILSFAFLIIHTFINAKEQMPGSFSKFIKQYYLPIGLTIILMLSLAASNKLYLLIFKDCFNAIILLILLYIMMINIRSKENCGFFSDNLITFLIFTPLLIPFLQLVNLFYNLQTTQSHNLNTLQLNSAYLSLSPDYNFISLFIILGMISIIYSLIKINSTRKVLTYNLILIIYSFCILFSASRRAIFILFSFFILLLLVQIFAIFFKDPSVKRMRSTSGYFLITVFVLTISVWYFSFQTSIKFKNKVFEIIGTSNVGLIKNKITVAAFRYATIFDNKLTYEDIYKKIWLRGLTDLALDPDSGWGTREHKTIFPLNGENVEIVPSLANGYLMNSSCNPTVVDGSVFSSTRIGNARVKNGEIVHASVYCYVSPDFNGFSVTLFSEGATYGNTIAQYYIPDSKSNNFIQNRNILLNASDSVNHTNNLIYNGDFKYGTKFWLPYADSTTHEIIETPFGKGIRVSRTNGDGSYFSLLYNGRPIIYYAGHRFQIKFKYKIVKGEGIPFKIGWWVNEDNKGFIAHTLPLTITRLNDGWYEASCSYEFKETHYNLSSFLNSLQDYSTLDIADVEIVDIDMDDSLPLFVDQLLRIKGIWQKLELWAKCSDGEAPVNIYFSKYEATDFSELKGYVIFAYPQYEVISKQNKDSLLTGTPYKNLGNISKQIVRFKNENSINNRVVDIAKTEQYLTGLYFIPVHIGANLITIIDKDPIRKLISNLFHEDTVYYGYKNILHVDSLPNFSADDRLMRWKFSLQIFKKEYNWKQKMMGEGFNFLNWFGYYFLKDKTKSDWPHNPFLSILLYSGIIGLILYMVLLFKVFTYYLKYLKEYYLFFIFFLITFFFTFFSGGSPFDPPIMGFFVLLPFFIHSIHKNEDLQPLKETIINDKDFNHRGK